jgi:hypothetical protein
MTKANMEAAAHKWIFGKPISKPMLSQLTLALSQEVINAKEMNVGMEPIDKMEFATRMDLI